MSQISIYLFAYIEISVFLYIIYLHTHLYNTGTTSRSTARLTIDPTTKNIFPFTEKRKGYMKGWSKIRIVHHKILLIKIQLCH